MEVSEDVEARVVERGDGVKKAYSESFERRVIAHENNEAQRRTDELKCRRSQKHAFYKFYYSLA